MNKKLPFEKFSVLFRNPTKIIQLVIVAMVASVMHFGWFCLQTDPLRPDSLSYIEPAYGILEGEGFSTLSEEDLWTPAASRTPGYSVFLASVFCFQNNPEMVVIIQKLLMIGVSLLFYLICVNRFGFSKKVMFLAMLLLNLDLATVVAANSILTETLFTVVLVFLFIVLAQLRKPHLLIKALAAGVLAGICALVRPIGIVFFLPLVIYILLTHRPPKRAAISAGVFLVGFILLPGLWIYRNYQHFNEIGFSSISGKSLLYYRAAGALSFSNNELSYEDAVQLLKEKEREAVENKSRQLNRPLNPFEANQIRKKIGFQVLLDHPLGMVKTGIYGLGKILFGPAFAQRLEPVDSLHSLLIHGLQYIISVLWWVFGALGLLILWKEPSVKNKHVVLLVVFIAYFILMSTGMEAYSRFRVPFMPFLAILAARGILALFQMNELKEPFFSHNKCFNENKR